MLDTPNFTAQVADTVREPLLVLDGELRVVAANRAYYRVFSATREETVGTAFARLGDGQWNRPPLQLLLEEVLPHETEFERFEVASEFPRIGWRVMWLSGREILPPETGRRTILIAIEDVTARRIAENALAQRTRELEESNRELERFAAVASHDLQEPLRKIRTYGELLQQRHAEVLDDGARVYVERMSQAAARMQTLIEDLLVLSRVTARARPPIPVELTVIVRDVLVDLEVALREAEGRVVVGALPVVLADPVQMRQLFQNLLSNAVKFRRSDVPLEIVVAATSDSSSPRPSHEITVRDNGIGFEQRHAMQIFEPFARLHGRSEYVGTGIGLAICRRIVERHGGGIRATSSPGAGASFGFTLPARGAHSLGPPSTSQVSP